MQSLMQTIGYTFRDPSLLELALSHPSGVLGGQPNNQRLEFLGDAVLQLCASHSLYLSQPQMHEGQLSRLRASLVQESSLHAVALSWKLGPLLRLGIGEEMSGGREKPSILADAVEAILGAVYLDGGLQEADRIVKAHILSQPPPPKARDYKTELQELTQKHGGAAPVYEPTGEEGPPHDRLFFVRVVLPDGRSANGQGRSKKAAQQDAAKCILETLLAETEEH